MPDTPASRPRSRFLRPGAVPLAIAAAVIIGALLYQSTSSVAVSFGGAAPAVAEPPAPRAPSSPADRRSTLPIARPALPVTANDAAVTTRDGLLPSGVTAADEEYPGIARLDPDLRAALADATADAAEDGIRISVTSGWRSRDYQDELLREAVARYGSRREAARWVATPETSPHVAGDAVDIGSAGATAWLSEHGAGYGLCPIYRNEPWHFELRPGAVDGRCPRMYADPTEDPRLRG